MSSTMSDATASAEETVPDTLLFVDDEANILSSLKRLFRAHGYRIFTAESGAAGLKILEVENIDLIISDMRMPEMSGAQFLEQARAGWPDVIRILLTGYADIGSTIDAINKGQIYRYISKPWDENDIVLCVQQALERKHLQLGKKRLEALIQRQNDELKELNASLEVKVKARTEEVRQTMGFLDAAHEQLKKTFITAIRVFSNLVEMREGPHAGQSKRMAEHARALAIKMGMTPGEAQDVLFAALLRDIGKIGWPDRLVRKPYFALTSEERADVIKHPAAGQTLLMEIEQLGGAAKLIRSHHERFDGQGYPDGLKGANIPLGARIITVVNDYDGLQNGGLLSEPMKPKEAMQYIIDHRGSCYDTQVADKFIEMLKDIEKKANSQPPVERALETRRLLAGMTLSRDLYAKEGMLLLSKEVSLSLGVIEQLISYEISEKQRLTVYVHA